MTNIFPVAFHISKTATIILLLVALVFNTAFVFTMVVKPQKANAFDVLGFISDVVNQAIQRIIFNFVTNAIRSAFNFVMSKIQNNFLVRNFLRYDAVLADKRYYTDYITGNFPEGDTGIFLRDFTYQINRGGRGYDPSIHENIALRTRAARGFATADPLQDDYIDRLKNLSNVWTNPTMVFFGMQDQSLKAQSEAKRASALNLTSEGLKTSFAGLGSDSVKVGVNTVASIEEQTLNAVYRQISSAPSSSGASWASLIGDALGNSISSFFFSFLNDQLNGGFVFRDDIPSYPPRFDASSLTPVAPGAAAIPSSGAVPDIPATSSSCQFNPATGQEECSSQIFCQNNPALCIFNVNNNIDSPPEPVCDPAIDPTCTF